MERHRLVTIALLLSAGLNSQASLWADEVLDQILSAGSSGIPWFSVATEDRSTRTPEPGSGEVSIGPGEPMYSERHQEQVSLVASVAVLKDAFEVNGRYPASIAPGTVLANFTLTDAGKPDVYMRCSKGHTAIKQTLLSGPVFSAAICFREAQGYLVPHFFRRYKAPGDVRLRYELQEEVAETAMRGVGSYELLYQGVGGGVLRLTYREYTGDDLARPAFSQDVTYDIAPDGPTEILFKGAHLTILGASNTAIRYRVDTPFKQSSP